MTAAPGSKSRPDRSQRRRALRDGGSVGTLVLTLAMTFAVASTHAAWAAEIEDIEFADQIEAGETTMPLFGLGLLRYKILFRGYVGGLYLPDGVPAERTLEDVPKVLELYYFWDIEAPLFGEAADDLLARNHPPERIAALRSRLDRLHGLYRDVKAGDRYRLTYVPGDGMSLHHNGELLGTIPGADFASDYFGIWLGEAPLNDAFRDQMFERFGTSPKS